MKLVVSASSSLILGPKEVLEQIHNHFSFRDRAAESQIHRFRKSTAFKERLIVGQGGKLPESYRAWKTAKLEELQKSVLVHCCRLEESEGNSEPCLVVPTGLVSSLIKLVQEKNWGELVTEDRRDFNRPRRQLSGRKPGRLREPQERALEIVSSDRQALEQGLGLFRMATGVGKTQLAQEFIRHFGVRSIFLVPSLPILKQTIRRFEQAFGVKNVKAFGGGKKSVGYITVATYQSVFKADAKEFDSIDLVVADECHHVAADTFFDVLQNKLKNAVHRYGLTAFEERADNATLLIESAVGPVVFQYDAPEAIRDGYLAKPTFVIFDVWRTRGHWTKYKIQRGKRVVDRIETSKEYDGDNDLIAYRNWMLGNDILNSHVAGLTQAFVSDGKSVLILVDEKEHGDRLQALLPDAGYAVGGGGDNERLLREFNTRKLKVLIGTSTLGEGADTIPVDILINLQGGASYSRTLQADGRALRNDPDEHGVPRKPTALIIDFAFPLCKLLNRHSQLREFVHKRMGQIHRDKVS